MSVISGSVRFVFYRNDRKRNGKKRRNTTACGGRQEGKVMLKGIPVIWDKMYFFLPEPGEKRENFLYSGKNL